MVHCKQGAGCGTDHLRSDVDQMYRKHISKPSILSPAMTDLTPTLNGLLSKQGSSLPKPISKTADEFLKEAYRIVSHKPAKQPSITQSNNARTLTSPPSSNTSNQSVTPTSQQPNAAKMPNPNPRPKPSPTPNATQSTPQPPSSSAT